MPGLDPIGFEDYNPEGSLTPTLLIDDILSRLSQESLATVAQFSSDRVTYCHEATHSLHAQIRNTKHGHYNCAYVGGGKAAVWLEPNVTLADVADRVTMFRNNEYELYLVQAQQYWNRQPLYIIDEWTAYCNGSTEALQEVLDDHGSHYRMNWFSHYADCLLEAIVAKDFEYEDYQRLTAFVDWQKERVNFMMQHIHRNGV